MVHTFNPSAWESHAFNPSTREVETGRDMAGHRERERNIRREENGAQGFCLRMPRDRILPIWSEHLER